MVSPCYCVVCAVRLQFKILWQGYIKKKLRFHQRVYRWTITRRYFTESCKKIMGLCHFHRRIYRRNITCRYFIESYKKITGLCHHHRCVHRRLYRRHIPMESPTNLRTSRSARMSDTCPSAHIPTALPTTNTDGITDGFTHIPKRTHVWHVSVCTNTDGSKSLAGFLNFFCAHFN